MPCVPYLTRKKVKILNEKPLVLKVDITDDKFPKHYNVDHSLSTFIHIAVRLLVDEENRLKCYINKEYKFRVKSVGHYDGTGYCNYYRWIILPNDLVNDFGIDEDNGLELVFKKIEISGVISRIFSERMEYGSMDFEPQLESGDNINGHELFLNTVFSEEFYRDLTSEINNAFRVRLFTATLVLVRKLFEKLIIDLFREEYGKTKLDLFFDKDYNSFHSFHVLIKNLEKTMDDFIVYDYFKSKQEQKDLLKFLRKIKDEGNAAAHSKIFSMPPEKIVDFKPQINKYGSLFDQLVQKVKATKK